MAAKTGAFPKALRVTSSAPPPTSAAPPTSSWPPCPVRHLVTAPPLQLRFPARPRPSSPSPVTKPISKPAGAGGAECFEQAGPMDGSILGPSAGPAVGRPSELGGACASSGPRWRGGRPPGGGPRWGSNPVPPVGPRSDPRIGVRFGPESGLGCGLGDGMKQTRGRRLFLSWGAQGFGAFALSELAHCSRIASCMLPRPRSALRRPSFVTCLFLWGTAIARSTHLRSVGDRAAWRSHLASPCTSGCAGRRD